MDRLQTKTILAYAAIYLIWGSTFFGVSIALKSFPPFMMSAFRFLIGGLVLAFYCYLKKESMPTAKEIVTYSFWGIVIFGGGVIAVAWAQQYLSSSLAAIIITTPFWFIVLDRSQWRINFRSGWIISGLLAGLSGVILLLYQKSSTPFETVSSAQIKAILVIVLGSLLWVIGSLRLRRKKSDISIYTKTAIHLIAASVFAFVVSILSNELSIFQVRELRIDSVVALVSLSLLSTTATFMAFVWLLQTKPVAMVSTYSYVNPIVAVLLGVFLGRESINVMQIMSMFIILLGVLFINIPIYMHKIVTR